LNFFDTNILVAASIPSHVHHEASHECLARIRKAGAVCAAHTLTEAFSVLTRLPVPYRLSPADTMRIVEDTSDFCTLVSLTSVETIRTLRSLADRNMGGGLVFDALLLACARKSGAKSIYTNSYKHFRRIAPDLANRIHEP
jgi:predicted nucleic acid-binding protein